MLPLRRAVNFAAMPRIKKGSGGLRGALQSRAVDLSIEAEALFMRHGSRRNVAAHHLADLATGKTDIAEQVVVEREQVGIGVPARGALEEGREQAHFEYP